jgi:hypothetical protein
MKATAGQIRALQSLWARYAHAADLGDARATRLQWAAQQLGRAVASFTELSGTEAGVLIEALKRELGQPVSAPRRRRMDREQAEVFSKHGKHGYRPEAEVMATDADREEIYQLAARVGMMREQLDTWLASRHSPLGRAGGRLLTMTHIGKARWALRSMLRRKALERVS